MSVCIGVYCGFLTYGIKKSISKIKLFVIGKIRARRARREQGQREGRVALGQAMVEPILRALDYQSIGRSLLRVDELPQAAYARYARYESEIRRQAEIRTGIPLEVTRNICSICGSTSGDCSHLRNSRIRERTNNTSLRCGCCGIRINGNGGNRMCSECSARYRSNVEDLQILAELDRLRLEQAMLSFTPSITIPISNNYSEVTAEEMREARFGSIWGSDVHVSNMMGSVLNEADSVNNVVSNTLEQEFNKELDRDTYSADR